MRRSFLFASRMPFNRQFHFIYVMLDGNFIRKMELDPFQMLSDILVLGLVSVDLLLSTLLEYQFLCKSFDIGCV